MASEIKLKRSVETTFRDEDSSWIALDVPELKPPLYANAFILFLSAFFFTALIYSAVTKIPVHIESAGRLANEKPAIPVRAMTNFTVDMVYVKENQVVKIGEPLLATREGLKYAELELLKELRGQLQYLNSKNSFFECSDCQLALVNASKGFDQLTKSRRNIKAAKPIAETSKILYSNLLKFKEIDNQLLPQKNRLAQLTQIQARSRAPASVAAGNLQIENLRNSIGKYYAPYTQNIQQLQAELKIKSQEFSAQTDELIRASGTEASVGGKVVNIRMKGEGEVIGAGQVLMEIVPLDNRLMAVIEVANRDIGSVKVGDAVELSIDAYPEADFGVIAGQIQEILPGDTSDQTAPLQDKGFKVRVALNTQTFKMGKNSVGLLPGMTLRSRIQKKNETLLNTFYRSLFRVKEDLRARS